MTTSENSTTVGQQYNLKWTNHTNNILQMFSEQLVKECLVDVTLSCEGQFIKAHKMVLSACSPYFQELFKLHAVEHPLIIMNGVQFSTVKQMIDFMYQGEIKVGDADLDHLLTIAENLQIKGLCKIRREKNQGENGPSGSDILKTHNINTQSKLNASPTAPAPPKGRKRKKQSQSPTRKERTQSFVSESQVNGNSCASNAIEVPVKVPNLTETSRGEADKSIPKLDSLKQPQTSSNLNDDKSEKASTAKIPRPPNAFMIFANEWRKKLAVEHLGESNKEISVRLGNMWKALPSTTKDVYYQAARKADEDHKVKYPGYYYSPKEARLRKEMRGSNSRAVSAGSTKTVDSNSVKTVISDIKTETAHKELQVTNQVKDEDSFTIFDEENDSSSNSSSENGVSTAVSKE